MKNLIILILLIYSNVCIADLGTVLSVKDTQENITSDLQNITQEANLIGAILGEDEKKKYLQKYNVLQQEKMTQKVEMLLNTTRVLYSNYLFSIIIFLSVHISLFFGLYVSIREVLQAKNLSRSIKESEVSISYKSIAIKTIMNGTVLFSITLVLYFIFIAYVYPVTIVDTSQSFNNKQTETGSK